MIITEILARNARIYPDVTALIERRPATAWRREITWREFDDQVNRIAGALAARGMVKGDRILLMMENCIEWLPIYFGILRGGGLAVPIDFTLNEATVKHCLALADPCAIFYGRHCRALLERMQVCGEYHVQHVIEVGPDGDVPDYAERLVDILAGDPEPLPDVVLSLLDDAALYFTSGSTGLPKAAVLTHRNLEFACYLENIQHKHTRQDIFLCIPPFFHTGAIMHWFGGFLVGGTGVIIRSFTERQLFEAISEEGATVVWLLVPLAKAILCQIESRELHLEDYKIDQWRLMHIGAQPVSPSLIAEWLKNFPTQQYNTTYGLTETTGPGCIQLGMRSLHKVGAIGKPGFDWEVRIVDDSLREMSRGQAGRLMVKGPGVFKEYYNDPEATRKYLKDGWFITGDIAMRDDDGFIWYIDRQDDVILIKERPIYPVELENFLLLHKYIQDAAVFGLRRGDEEIVAALIQVKSDHSLTEADLEEFCQAMPPIKRPSVFFFGEVPRGLTGKIKKFEIKTRYRQHMLAPLPE